MRRVFHFSFLFSTTTLVLISATFAQGVYRLPQIASGADVIRTTFIFVNNSDQESVVTLKLTDDSGNSMNLSIPGMNGDSIKVFTLPARESRFFTSDPSGDLKIGSGLVTATSNIGVAAVFSFLGGGGSTLLTEAGIGASQAVSEFSIAVDTKAPFNTGVAIQNLGFDSTTLTMTLFDKNGNQQSTRNDITLPKQGHLAKFVSGDDGLFPSAVNFEGRLVVSSSLTQVSALTLRQNTAAIAPLTTLPAVATTSNQREFNLSNVANGFAGTLGIKTQFIFFSLGTEATAHLALTNDAGNPLSVGLSNGETGSVFDLDIPAGGAVFVETDAQGAITTGAARVTSDVPIGVTAVFSLLNAEGTVTVEAGVGDSPLGTQFSLPVDLTGGFNTGVAIFNPNPDSTTVQVAFLKSDGTNAAQKELSIPAYGHISVFVQSAALFPSLTDVQGQLNLESTLPVTALSLRQQLSTANLTTLPVLEGIPDQGNSPTPSKSNLLRKTIEGLNFNTDQNGFDIRLDAGYKLSGAVEGSGGTFYPIGFVQAISPSGEVYTTSTNVVIQFPSITYKYSMVVPKGTYLVRACAVDVDNSTLPADSAIAPAANPEYTAVLQAGQAGNVIVNGDTTQNVEVSRPQYRVVTGTVTNLNELPVNPTSQTLFLILASDDTTTQAFSTLDDSGGFAVRLSAGTYTAGLAWGEGTDTTGDGIPDTYQQLAILWDIGSITVAGSPLTGVNLALPDLATVSGKLSQRETNDFSESQVLALDLAFPSNAIVTQCVPIAGVGASFAQPNAAGDYELTVVKNKTYDVLGAVPIVTTDGSTTAPLPGSDRRTFSQETNTLNRTVPAKSATVTISGQITDPDGNPVSGATISGTTIGGLVGEPNATFSGSTTSDAGGNYTLRLLSGFNYVIEVDPPNSNSTPTVPNL